MKDIRIPAINSPDTVMLRPSDIAILVSAAERMARIMVNAPNLSMVPADCVAAVFNVTARRINKLVQELEESTPSDGEILVDLAYGDRQFFAEILCAYHSHAKDLVWALGWDSLTSEEASTRRKAISERYADIFMRLGGTGWEFDDCF